MSSARPGDRDRCLGRCDGGDRRDTGIWIRQHNTDADSADCKQGTIHRSGAHSVHALSGFLPCHIHCFYCRLVCHSMISMNFPSFFQRLCKVSQHSLLLDRKDLFDRINWSSNKVWLVVINNSSSEQIKAMRRGEGGLSSGLPSQHVTPLSPA